MTFKFSACYLKLSENYQDLGSRLIKQIYLEGSFKNMFDNLLRRKNDKYFDKVIAEML